MLSWVEINLKAYRNNLKILRENLDAEIQIMAVVKANAYGHGLIESARTIWTSGADQLAVINVDEGVGLRIAKIKAPILVLGYAKSADMHRAIDFDIALSLFDLEQVYQVDQEARKINKWAKVHVKINTGLNRLGFDSAEAMEAIQTIYSLKHIRIEGIFSHFAAPADRDYSHKQLMEMQNLLFKFQQNNMQLPTIHMAATDASAYYPEAHFNMVRLGLAVYGLTDLYKSLEPVLSFKTKIVQIRRVPPEENIGYDLTYKTKKPAKIAVLSIGYADGYPKALSNVGEVLIHKRRAKIVGKISMNLTTVDVTGINANVGDEAVLIGNQDNVTLKAQELVKWGGMDFAGEIVSQIPANIRREYKL